MNISSEVSAAVIINGDCGVKQKYYFPTGVYSGIGLLFEMELLFGDLVGKYTFRHTGF